MRHSPNTSSRFVSLLPRISSDTIREMFCRPAFPILLSAFWLLTPAKTEAELIEHAGASFLVYRVDSKSEKVELHLAEKPGEPNTFPKLEARLQQQGRRLKFAMNSGIFEGTFLPTGLHVAGGKVITPLNLDEFEKTSDSLVTPNFFLKPNGVFFIRRDGSSAIIESHRYTALNESPLLATQSGPLLVEEGRIHPALSRDSPNVRFRNGVGVTTDGEIIFACSLIESETGRCNLYRFAELFRERLDCPNALYLDGEISYVFIPDLTGPIVETNFFAGILAITEPAP